MKESLTTTILEHITTHTSTCLYAQDYAKLGVSATAIKDLFYIDRSNASRILNQLFHAGMLCKKVGRPTLYISFPAIRSIYPNHSVPKILLSNQSIEEFLRVTKIPHVQSYAFPFPIIGNSPNEALYPCIKKAKKILVFPEAFKIIVVNGSTNIMKTTFHKAILEFQKKKETSSKAVSYNTAFDDPVLFSSTWETFLAQHSGNKIIQLTITNHLTTSQFEQLYAYIRQNMSLHPDVSLLLIDLALGKSNAYLETFYPMITLPTYFDLTAKEKIEYVFQYIHKEATRINRTIHFNKNLVCCIIMCNLVGSLENLEQLIHHICMNAYQDMLEAKDLKLTLENLPDEILAFIEGSTPYMEAINHIFHLFTTTSFYAFPGIEFIELRMLKEAKLNEKQELVYIQNNDNDSILAACRQEIQTHQTHYIPHGDEEDASFQQLCSIISDSLSLKEQDNKVLAHHLQQAIYQIHNRLYQEKSVLNDTSRYVLLCEKATQLVECIEAAFILELPLYEKIFINTFIIYCTQLQIKTRMGIIFCMSNPKLADVYSLTMNQTYHEDFTTSSAITFTKFYDDYKRNYQLFKEELRAMDCDKGIVILTNSYLPFNLIHNIKQDVHSNIKVSTDLSDALIKKLFTLYQDDHATFDDVAFLDEYARKSSDNSIESDSNQNLLDVLHKTLQSQLAFLDVYKVIPFLNEIFQQITEELDLRFSNNLLITFLMHSSFVLERSIKKEPLPYKSINTLQRKHSHVYNAVYHSFHKAEHFFNCHIAESELAYVVEMFVDALTMNDDLHDTDSKTDN